MVNSDPPLPSQAHEPHQLTNLNLNSPSTSLTMIIPRSNDIDDVTDHHQLNSAPALPELYRALVQAQLSSLSLLISILTHPVTSFDQVFNPVIDHNHNHRPTSQLIHTLTHSHLTQSQTTTQPTPSISSHPPRLQLLLNLLHHLQQRSNDLSHRLSMPSSSSNPDYSLHSLHLEPYEISQMLSLIATISPRLRDSLERSLVQSLAALLNSTHQLTSPNPVPISTSLHPSDVSNTNPFLIPSASSADPPNHSGVWSDVDSFSQTLITLVKDRLTSDPFMSSSAPSVDEKLQRDLQDILESIERLYAISPQLANQRAHPSVRTPCSSTRTPPSTHNANLSQTDEVVAAIERMTLGRIDSQRASLPSLVSQGVAPMGWRVRRSIALSGSAELELLERLERAGGRRLGGQRSLHPNVKSSTSPMAFYSESMRETEAIESIFARTGDGRIESQDASFTAVSADVRNPTLPDINHRRLSISTLHTLDNDFVENERCALLANAAPEAVSSDSPDAFQDRRPNDARAQSMPNIWSLGRKLARPAVTSSPDPIRRVHITGPGSYADETSFKITSRRGLFGKRSHVTASHKSSPSIDLPPTPSPVTLSQSSLPNSQPNNQLPTPNGTVTQTEPTSNKDSQSAWRHEPMALAA